MVTLYRCPAPTNYLCACGRVARELKAQGIENEQLRVPWRRSQRSEVEEISGQRVVPVLVIGGQTICDSRRIVEHLRRAGDDGHVGASAEHRATEDGAGEEDACGDPEGDRVTVDRGLSGELRRGSFADGEAGRGGSGD